MIAVKSCQRQQTTNKKKRALVLCAADRGSQQPAVNARVCRLCETTAASVKQTRTASFGFARQRLCSAIGATSARHARRSSTAAGCVQVASGGEFAVAGSIVACVLGDLVREDEKRNLFVVGRLKELIKVNAYQVAPTELETHIGQLEGVSDCAVVGVPNEASGELPYALIVRADNDAGRRLQADDVARHVASHLSAYKHLKGGVDFVSTIPRSEAGKLLRRRILSEYLEKRQKSKL